MKEALKRIEFAKKHNTNFLDLSDLQLMFIPGEIKELVAIEKLWLNNNQIEDISVLSYLTQLKELYIPNNKITDISRISELRNLTHLGLSGNKLSSIESLERLENIEVLMCQRNSIENIDIIRSLVKLKIFFSCENRIKNLGPLSFLNNLEVVQVFGNPIEHFGKLTCHLRLSIQGKKVEIPPEIARQGDEAVNIYIKSLRDGIKPLNEVKVILIGDGASGKTSLIKRLHNLPFNPQEEQTHGIKIKKETVSINNELITLHFWDFGGQEIMHATHQFFMTNRSIYVIVVDSRKDEKIEYWLKHVEAFGGDSPVIVAVNKVDENPSFDLNRRFLVEKYQNIKAFHRISCATNQGIDGLYKYLVETAFKMETRKVGFSPNWFNVKEQLDKENSDFISYNSYRSICIKNGVEVRKDQNILLEYLNSLGIILHFEKLKLYDTQVLNPRWLTNAVYRVINSPSVSSNFGYFDLNMILEALLQSDKENDFEYPDSKIIFIVRIMQQFELCYSLKGIDDKFIIPDLLPVEEPVFDYKKFPLRFIIKYDFLPPTVIPRFIVQMHDRIKDRLCWRTGLVIYESLFNSTAFIKVDKEEKEFQIWVDGERRRDLLSFIRRTIIEINSTYKNISYRELVPVPGENNFFLEYEDLIGHEESGRRELFVGKLRKGFSVKELLNGVESPEYRIQENKINIFIAYSNKDKRYKDNFVKHLKPINFIKLWDLDSINPGESTNKVLVYFQQAQIVFALLSADFIHSFLFQSTEFNEALERNKIIPIRIRPFELASLGISEIQSLPREGYIETPENDRLWVAVIKEIEKILKNYR